MLAAMDLIFGHMKRGTVAGAWPTERPLDELTGRNPNRIAQSGLELEIPDTINEELRARLGKESPHLDKSVEQLAAQSALAIILNCSIRPRPFTMVQNIATGAIRTDGAELTTTGMNLLTVPAPVGAELAAIQESVATMRSDRDVLENVKRSPRELDMMFSERENMPPRQFYVERMVGSGRLSNKASERFSGLTRTSTSSEEFLTALGTLMSQIAEDIKQRNSSSLPTA
jgi:hypothetical protein